VNGRRILVVVATVALLWPAHPTQAGTNTVPTTYLTRFTKSRALSELRPTDCQFITVSTLVTRGASSTVTGTSGNDLVLGGPAADSINAANGADCILGGDGIDTINGGPGTDVCIGGGGIDIFVNCETPIQ
jgi:Ca2+-binding RTX toxin-like protein